MTTPVLATVQPTVTKAPIISSFIENKESATREMSNMQSPPNETSGRMKKKTTTRKPPTISTSFANIIQPLIEVPKLKFSDMGGVNEQFLEVLHLAMHMKRPEIHEQLNVQPPTGFLVHGPPGCGKIF